jgi:hypothetical protein
MTSLRQRMIVLSIDFDVGDTTIASIFCGRQFPIL